jgi:phage baseplate assembly protein W
MAEFEVTTNPVPIIFGASGLDEIYQNLRMIITTPEFSVPMDRAFAWSPEVDLPETVAQAKITARVSAAIRKNEPRVQLISIRFESDSLNGRLKPIIKVRVIEEAT